jgi:hypothetical protein
MRYMLEAKSIGGFYLIRDTHNHNRIEIKVQNKKNAIFICVVMNALGIKEMEEPYTGDMFASNRRY